MKVLFINHFPLTGSGSGVYTANLAKSLARKGIEVAIVFPENRSEYEKYENIKLYPVFFKDKEEISNVGQVSMNFPCFTTHPRSTFNFREMTDEQRRVYEEIFFNKINNVIEDFKPDVIHAQHIWTLAGIAAKCCEEKNIPLIITCHGTDLMGINDEENTKAKWGSKWAKEAIKYASKIVTISKDSKQLAESIFPEIKDKIIWIRNGVDSHVFFKDDEINKKQVLNSLGIEDKYDRIVAFAGKLTRFKGVDILLDATKKYEENNILTIVAGDGELKDELKEQAENLKLKNVIFIGNQPQNKLTEIYNIADCSCVPSRREPFGLVAAEAMLCGTPVIATNDGGLVDFVTPDVGILINPDNPNELAGAIEKILNKEITFDRNHIAKKIKELYSQDAIIDEFIKIYNNI